MKQISAIHFFFNNDYEIIVNKLLINETYTNWTFELKCPELNKIKKKGKKLDCCKLFPKSEGYMRNPK